MKAEVLILVIISHELISFKRRCRKVFDGTTSIWSNELQK